LGETLYQSEGNGQHGGADMMELPFDVNEYNPKTSQKLADWSPGENPGGFLYEVETLYRTEKGSYFILLEGGLFSRFHPFPGSEIWYGGSNIKPVSDDEALGWCEETGNFDVIDEHFSGGEAMTS